MNKKDIKILLVDDEPDILEIVGYNLSNEGYQIITAENGGEAVKKAKKEIPHLIILDTSVFSPPSSKSRTIGHKPKCHLLIILTYGSE